MDMAESSCGSNGEDRPSGERLSAADAVSVVLLTFEDEHAGTSAGHQNVKRRAGQAATDDDQIVGLWNLLVES